MKTYACILGSHPAISVAEITKVIAPNTIIIASDSICLFESSKPIDAQTLQTTLGGTIKVVEILQTLNTKNVAASHLTKTYLPFAHDGKNVIGVSSYGLDAPALTLSQRTTLTFKKELKAKGFSVRIVQAKEHALSSVQVIKNDLLRKGAELVVISSKRGVLIGKTLAVQHFEAYAARDYGRPIADARSGMLPPKLARMMINLSGANAKSTLFDPFCGTGTVLSEAIDLGVQTIIGSDISAKAITDAQTNIDWLLGQPWNTNKKPKVNIFQHDATQPLAATPKMDVIVGETFLGPPKLPTGKQYTTLKKQLTSLYGDALAQLKTISKPSTRIVLAIPMFRTRDEGWDLVDLDWIQKSGFSLEKPLNETLVQDLRGHLNARGNLVYARATARVGRELLLLVQSQTPQ